MSKRVATMAQTPKDAVVELAWRKFNNVDCYKRKIRIEQKECQHDYRLTRMVNLIESKVSGTFILEDQSARNRAIIESDLHAAIVVCLKCSKELFAEYTKACPRCLGLMKKGKRQDRELYFEEEYLGHSARKYTCTRCDFRGVADE